MFLLTKVFQLRDKANPESEKPFLDHLEDLRVMITRCVVALTITTIACFTFQEDLMKVLREPVDQVMFIHMEKTLPKEIPVKEWQRAREVDDAANNLREPEREPFLQQFDGTVRHNADTVRLLRAAKVMPEAQRQDFLSRTTDAETTKRILSLIELQADVGQQGPGNLQMMSALSPTETFMLSMKLSFFAGIVLAFPLLIMFVLQFVLPGLHAHERRVLWPAMGIGFGLFLTGVLFAYYLILPKTLTFFYEWSGSLGVSNDWRIGEYITFATQFTLLFGLSFELPVVVMVAVKLGLLTHEMMRKTRSYAVLAIVIAAAVITPTPDALTMSLMAGPMIFLYEACIWLAWFDERKRTKAEAAAQEEEDRTRMERLLTDLEQVEATEKDRQANADRHQQEDDGPPDFRGDG